MKGESLNRSLDWVLIARYMSRECSEEEKERVERDPELREMVGSLEAYLSGAVPSAPENGANDPDEVAALGKMHEAIARMDAAALGGMETLASGRRRPAESAKGKIRRLSTGWAAKTNSATFFKVAAAVVLLFGVLYVSSNLRTIFVSKKPAMIASYEFSTARGGRKRLLLSDGTEITLNSASRIEISRSYGKGSRLVKLQGEAFFDVAHHKNPPFTVETTSGVIQDVGTEFNVKAWPGSGETEVAVTRGEIMFRPQDSSASGAVSVAAGQVSVAGRRRILLRPEKRNLGQYVAWLKGAMVFDRTPFKEVLSELGRQYPATFIVPDSSLLSKRVTASLARQPLTAILRAISVSLDIRCVNHGDTILFERQGGDSHKQHRKRQRNQS